AHDDVARGGGVRGLGRKRLHEGGFERILNHKDVKAQSRIMEPRRPSRGRLLFIGQATAIEERLERKKWQMEVGSGVMPRCDFHDNVTDGQEWLPVRLAATQGIDLQSAR